MSHESETGSTHDAATGRHEPPRRAAVGWIKGTLRLFGPSVVVGLVAPFVFPGLRRAARPVTKGFIHGALSLSESFKEAATEAREQVSDWVAEVKAEREKEAQELASSQTKDDA
jgi:hypothetical protein